MKRFGDIFAESELAASGCRVWAGRTDRYGYGRSGQALAHRRAYAIFVAPIPEGMTVDHLCFNKRCVEPSHLRLLTVAENRENQRSAYKEECVNGHEYTPENTYIKPRQRGQGRRDCRACIRERAREYAARRRAAKAAS